MNKLLIPPSLNWFESSASACAPDNTIVFGSRNDIVLICPKPPEEPADVQILPRGHSDKVVSVAVNPGWGNPRKLIVSAAEDKIVRLWDLDTEEYNKSHSGHTTFSSGLVAAAFAGNDKIVSASEDGQIIIWRYMSKELSALNNILGTKAKVTCISPCPHTTWLIAVGSKFGVITIVDLRGTGRILHRLNGHESKNVISLSWCPTPFNVFPMKKSLHTFPGMRNHNFTRQQNTPEDSNCTHINADINEQTISIKVTVTQNREHVEQQFVENIQDNASIKVAATQNVEDVQKQVVECSTKPLVIETASNDGSIEVAVTQNVEHAEEEVLEKFNKPLLIESIPDDSSTKLAVIQNAECVEEQVVDSHVKPHLTERIPDDGSTHVVVTESVEHAGEQFSEHPNKPLLTESNPGNARNKEVATKNVEHVEEHVVKSLSKLLVIECIPDDASTKVTVTQNVENVGEQVVEHPNKPLLIESISPEASIKVAATQNVECIQEQVTDHPNKPFLIESILGNASSKVAVMQNVEHAELQDVEIPNKPLLMESNTDNENTVVAVPQNVYFDGEPVEGSLKQPLQVAVAENVVLVEESIGKSCKQPFLIQAGIPDDGVPVDVAVPTNCTFESQEVGVSKNSIASKELETMKSDNGILLIDETNCAPPYHILPLAAVSSSVTNDTDPTSSVIGISVPPPYSSDSGSSTVELPEANIPSRICNFETFSLSGMCPSEFIELTKISSASTVSLETTLNEYPDMELSLNHTPPLDVHISTDATMLTNSQLEFVNKPLTIGDVGPMGPVESSSSENIESVADAYALKEDDASEEEAVIRSRPMKEYLLASTVQGGRSIIIWRAGTDGQKQAELYFPSQTNWRHKKDDKTWMPVCWIKPKSLLSSSPKHELVEWILPEAVLKKTSQRWRLIHGDHFGTIFNIVAPIRSYESADDEDFRDKHLLNAWTFAKDRVILNTNLSANRETLALYPTLSGGVHLILPSPLTPNRMAVASGDGCCRLWDVCRPHLQYISMSGLLDRSKITCLEWHPTNDVLFAFGSNEGKIAIMDSSNISKKPSYFVQYFSSTINQMQWGPIHGNAKNLGLYVLASGTVVVYNTSKPLNDPIAVDVTIDTSTYCFAWKPDFSICAFCTKSGTVIITNPELNCLVTLYLLTKCIKKVAWHCDATGDVDSDSSCSNWLAVASSEVVVYNCIINTEEPHDSQENDYKNIIASFTDHTGGVTCLAWSPHQEGILASSNDDGSVLVWNVKTKILMHCCRHSNLESVLSVAWSPLNADFIITGAKNSAVQIWKLTEHSPKQKIAKKARKRIIKVNHATDICDEIIPPEPTSHISDKLKCNADTKVRKNILCGLAYKQNDSCSVEEGTKNCKVMFDYFLNQINKDNELKVSANVENKISLTQIFGSKEDVNSLLELEKLVQCKTKYPSANEHISLWQGNIGEQIKIAIINETLTPWLISLAPMISSSLWQEACGAYADQLSKHLIKDPFVIASYYLICHKIEQAVEALCSMEKFREALAVAKIRLLPEDPLISKVLETWAEHSVKIGHYDKAFQCYMALNRLEDAAQILCKRSNAECLEMAAELARICENKDLSKAIMHRLTLIVKDTSTVEDENVLKPLKTRTELEINLAELTQHMENGTAEHSIDVHNAECSPVVMGTATDNGQCDFGDTTKVMT